MFIRNENFKQYINAYPVVSILIAINLVIYIMTLLPVLGDRNFLSRDEYKRLNPRR